MTAVNLPYGRSFLTVSVPVTAVVMKPAYGKPLIDPDGAAAHALRAPLKCKSLRDMAAGKRTVAIVTSDSTRPTPNHRIIPWILDELGSVPRDNIVIIIGTGSHRPCTGDEIRDMFGHGISEAVRIINHDAFDANALKPAGITERGDPVILNREYCDADVRVSVGFIEPHFFAGFSGGPKAVMPGIAGIDSIMAFHSPKMIAHPKADWGVLEGNPVYEMARDAALLCPPHLSFNVTLDGDRNITGIFAGDVVEAHLAGAHAVRRHAMIPCRAPFDVVIITNSGHPLDRSLYQAVKGMCTAASIIAEGGSIICAAECADGIPDHGNFRDIMASKGSPREVLDAIMSPGFSRFDMWQAQKLCSVLKRCDVYLKSSLSDEDTGVMHLKPCRDIDETLGDLLNKYGPNASVGMLPYGPMTIPYIAPPP